MEPLTMFASTVGFIGAFHLLSQAIKRLGRGSNNRISQSNQRKDWYCFFELSDLLGSDLERAENTKMPRDVVSKTDHMNQIRKQQAHRPRLHV